MPYPLNMAIMGVDPLYELLAILLVIICIYISLRRTLISALFTAGVLLITPSFVIAFNQIAWTAYAERYLYVPSAFIVLACTIYLNRHVQFSNPAIGKGIVMTILLAMNAGTVQRNITWQTNIALLKYTAEKSPWSKDAQVLYGILLAQSGDYVNSIERAEKADAIPRIEYATIRVPVIGDTRFESSETFALYLTENSPRLVQADAQAIGTIANDDVRS